MDEKFTCSGEEFYTAESCEDLIGAIHNCEDSIKYVYSSHSSSLDNEGAKSFEDKELMALYFDIRNACLEFVTTYDYYNFVHAEKFPKDMGEFTQELMERTKAYKAAIEDSNKTVLNYKPIEE